MKILSLKKNAEGDTECQLNLKGVIMILVIMFGIQFIAAMIVTGSTVAFTNIIMKDESSERSYSKRKW